MVVATKINYCTIIDLGFRTREQANEAFKGLKGNGFKTDDEYLKHYWDSYKHVIYKNKLEDLANEEWKERRYIFKNYLSYVINEHINFKSKVYIHVKYANLLDKYKLTEAAYDGLANIVCELRLENSHLKRCVEGLQHRIIELQESNESSINPNALQLIMSIKTKRTNQCYTCSICQEIIEKKETVYNICHMFHIKCFTIHLLNDCRCPNCRTLLLRDLIQ
jgi:hypothetical protein